MNRKTYPSDVSREQFERILPLLEKVRARRRGRGEQMYMKYFARFYICAKAVSNGTCYRKDFRAKSTAYDYFKLWKEKPCEDKPSLLEQALKKCGWGGPYQQWTQRENDFFDR